MILFIRTLNTNPNLKGVFFAGTVFALLFALLYFYQSLFIPIVASAFISYLLFPWVEFNIRHFKISRLTSVLICLATVLIVTSFTVASLFPALKYQVLEIARMVPRAKVQLLNVWLPWATKFVLSFGLISEKELTDFISNYHLTTSLGDPGQNVARLMNRTYNLLGGAISLGLVPLFTFFSLYQFEAARAFVYRLVPTNLRTSSIVFMTEMNDAFRTVLKGQLSVAFMLGILYMIGFSVIGLPFALALGAICGVCRIVPYLDAVVGVVISAMIVLTSDADLPYSLYFASWIVVGVIQTLDGMYITPKVVGQKVGLHPALVIASVFAFGHWFGFWGILVAIPALALLKICCNRLLAIYFQSDFYKGV